MLVQHTAACNSSFHQCVKPWLSSAAVSVREGQVSLKTPNSSHLPVHLPVFTSRCRFVWIVEFNWEHEHSSAVWSSSGMASISGTSDETFVPQWRLVSCNVAPGFSSSRADLPAGSLTTNFYSGDLSDISSCTHTDIGQFMVWANDGSCAPPRGFELLGALCRDLGTIPSSTCCSACFSTSRRAQVCSHLQCTGHSSWSSLCSFDPAAGC